MLLSFVVLLRLLSFNTASGEADVALIARAATALQKAEAALDGAASACEFRVPVKAARMQLELAKELADLGGARSMRGGLKDLASEVRKRCVESAAGHIVNAVRALDGKDDVDVDDDLNPEAPNVADAKARPSSQPTAPRPFVTEGALRSPPELEARVAALAKTAAPGFKPLGPAVHGTGKKTDWVQALEAGKCYAVVSVADEMAKKLAIYLWDPLGKRRADRRAREPQAVMYHCAAVSGLFHLQAKVKRDKAPYATQLFVR